MSNSVASLPAPCRMEGEKDIKEGKEEKEAISRKEKGKDIKEGEREGYQGRKEGRKEGRNNGSK